MYDADYHVHCCWSPDGTASMARMAQAGADAGLREICFTDHVEIMDSGETRRNQFDWSALEREYQESQRENDGRILIRRGAELGEAPRDFAWAETLLRTMPKVDFIIGSVHQLSGKYGSRDLCFAASDDPREARRQILDYLELVLSLAKWGNFSVLGHLTLPLRYMNEFRGLHMTFDGFEAEVSEIFRTLIRSGCGIEINTNHGHQMLPDAKWVRMYRRLGGEIITVGSDAHTPSCVGLGIHEAQQMLRECGFTRLCTFEKQIPRFHEL
jgi:histidinol-phosphatase (PHP family)